MKPLCALHASVWPVFSICFSLWPSSVALGVQTPGCTCDVLTPFLSQLQTVDLSQRSQGPADHKQMSLSGGLHRCPAPLFWMACAEQLSAEVPSCSLLPYLIVDSFLHYFFFLNFKQIGLQLKCRTLMVFSSRWAFKWGRNNQENFWLWGEGWLPSRQLKH